MSIADRNLQQASRDAFANWPETPPRATPIFNPRLLRIPARKRRPWILRQLTISGWCARATIATLAVIGFEVLR